MTTISVACDEIKYCRQQQYNLVMDQSESAPRAISALHGVSPYQGKLSPARARELVELLSTKGDLVVDPFCGCGTVLLEAWSLGRRGFGLDLNPYAIAVAKAKLSPIATASAAAARVRELEAGVAMDRAHIDLRRVPKWVRAFYHPETLRDALAWSASLRSKRETFLFGCFLNLLHHQRPGFLSFPAAHVTPHACLPDDRMLPRRLGKYPVEHQATDFKGECDHRFNDCYRSANLELL